MPWHVRGACTSHQFRNIAKIVLTHDSTRNHFFAAVHAALIRTTAVMVCHDDETNTRTQTRRHTRECGLPRYSYSSGSMLEVMDIQGHTPFKARGGLGVAGYGLDMV